MREDASGIIVCAPNAPLFRIERRSSLPLAAAPWRYQGGGRFDDPAGSADAPIGGRFRVVSLSSMREGAFTKTMSTLGRRRDPLDRILAATDDDADPAATNLFRGIGRPTSRSDGAVPTDWRVTRVMARVTSSSDLRFVDLTIVSTFSALAEAADLDPRGDRSSSRYHAGPAVHPGDCALGVGAGGRRRATPL